MGEQIASGASGKVFHSNWNGLKVATKTFDENSISFDIEEVRHEAAITAMIEHPNLVKCYGSSIKDLLIVMELCAGTLQQKLHDPKEEWDFNRTLDTLIQVVKPTMYLHSLDIIHRDLKSSNYLVFFLNQIIFRFLNSNGKLCLFFFFERLDLMDL